MSRRAVVVPVITLGVAAILLFTIEGCWTSWTGGSGEQQTDDAHVRADMTPLSTRVSGTVRKVEVEDFATVKRGQILVQLNDEDYQAGLAQAPTGFAGAEATREDNESAKRAQDPRIQNAETGIAQVNVGYTQIVAPSTGAVEERHSGSCGRAARPSNGSHSADRSLVRAECRARLHPDRDRRQGGGGEGFASGSYAWVDAGTN